MGSALGKYYVNAFTHGINKYKGDGQRLSQESEKKEHTLGLKKC